MNSNPASTARFIFCSFLLLLFFSKNRATAQPAFGTGLIEDDRSFTQNVEMYPDFSNDGRRAGDYPRRVSLRQHTPFAQNQGDANSCAGWSLGYGAMTTQRACREGATDREAITKSAFSAMFIYNQVKLSSCVSGTKLESAARFLQKNGTCAHREFDNPATDCQRVPSEDLKRNSKQNSIKDFVALFSRETPEVQRVTRTKRSIAEGKPVVIGFYARQSLTKLNKANPIWKPTDRPSDENLGGHSVVVIGYNDSTAIFELMNSWGRQWGDDGFFFMSYEAFAKVTFCGLQLVLADEEYTPAQNSLAATTPKIRVPITDQKPPSFAPRKNEPAPVADETLSSLSGQFVVQQFQTDKFGTLLTVDGQYQLNEIAPSRDGNFYRLTKTDWQEGDKFQILAKGIQKNSYVYLFSLDGTNKAEIHWPRNQRFDEHLKAGEKRGLGEGALVAHSGAEILIPGNDFALERQNLLDDDVVMINSAGRIDDFQQRVRKIRDQTSGDIADRVGAAFGDLLLPVDKLTLSDSAIQVEAGDLTAGRAIAVIVKIENR